MVSVTVLIASGLWFAALPFVLGMCRAAGHPTPAPPFSASPDACPEDVKQPVADTTGLNNPGYQRIAG